MGVIGRMRGSSGRRDASARETDVVILGAGFAGLMAARTVLAAGKDVLVVEARDRVGGRIWTRPAADGTPLDVGGQWVGPTQKRLLTLIEELGLSLWKSYDSGKNIQLLRGERHEYTGAIPTHDPLAAAETMETVLALHEMASEVPLDAPWQAPHASEWDSQTFHTWMYANVNNEAVRDLLTLCIQAVFSIEPRDLSLLHALFYMRSGGTLLNLISVTNGAQESRVTGGAQAVALGMAASLGERVILSAAAHTITQDERGVRVETSAGAIEARLAIIALPPPLAGRLRYVPSLPGYRDQLTQRMPLGTVIKAQCLYDVPFWREAGFSGQAIADTGAVHVAFDNTPPEGRPGILLGFVEGDEGRHWGRESAEARRAAILASFERFFGPLAASPREYVEQSWAEEEYTRGCYASFMPPGVWTSYGEALRAPIGRLHWAGTETATVWNGYMDGALQSGERAAHEVLAALGV
ncbi:MAG TPA: flavin monoamine oxidase family protein [Ktedonobacterales bacterium]